MFGNVGLGGFAILAVVTLVLFGRGKIGGLLAELGSGIADFRRELRPPAKPEPQILPVGRVSQSDGEPPGA